jgi:Acetyltransferase (GNAT) domain
MNEVFRSCLGGRNGLLHLGTNTGSISESKTAPPPATATRSRPVTWEILESPEGWRDETLRRCWSRLVEERGDPFAVHQSPIWFDHLEASRFGLGCSVAVARTDSGEIVGIAPLYLDHHPIVLHSVRRIRLRTRPLKILSIAGGQPTVALEGISYSGLVSRLIEANPSLEGISLHGVPVGSDFHAYVTRSIEITKRFFVCQRAGLEQIQTIPLPETYQAFLDRYDSKRRYNIRRQIRTLREFTEGRLEFRRITAPEDVQFFLEARSTMGRVRASVPQGEPNRIEPTELARLQDQAVRGLLRCYLLLDGDRPLASILGCQYGGVYMLGETRYNPAYEKHSPGTSLFHLAIEDLLSNNDMKPKLVSLGYGGPHASYETMNRKLRRLKILDSPVIFFFARGWIRTISPV